MGKIRTCRVLEVEGLLPSVLDYYVLGPVAAVLRRARNGFAVPGPEASDPAGEGALACGTLSTVVLLFSFMHW